MDFLLLSVHLYELCSALTTHVHFCFSNYNIIYIVTFHI